MFERSNLKIATFVSRLGLFFKDVVNITFPTLDCDNYVAVCVNIHILYNKINVFHRLDIKIYKKRRSFIFKANFLKMNNTPYEVTEVEFK